MSAKSPTKTTVQIEPSQETLRPTSWNRRAYYTWKAEYLLRDASEHQRLADAYANGMRFEPKTGIPDGLYGHCRRVVVEDQKVAQKARDLASMHDELAKNLALRSVSRNDGPR